MYGRMSVSPEGKSLRLFHWYPIYSTGRRPVRMGSRSCSELASAPDVVLPARKYPELCGLFMLMGIHNGLQY